MEYLEVTDVNTQGIGIELFEVARGADISSPSRPEQVSSVAY